MGNIFITDIDFILLDQLIGIVSVDSSRFLRQTSIASTSNGTSVELSLTIALS